MSTWADFANAYRERQSSIDSVASTDSATSATSQASTSSSVASQPIAIIPSSVPSSYPHSPPHHAFLPSSSSASSAGTSRGDNNRPGALASASASPPSRRLSNSPNPFLLSSPPTTSYLQPTTPSPKSRRRRSSVSSNGGGTSSTPFGSFVGSYENSLIQGRLSALPSLPLPFLASIGVLGSSDSPPKLRCPLHLTIPFGAFYYAGQEGEGAKSSAPYVGTIDLEAHYYSAMRDEPSVSDEREHHRHLPKFPGYRVPQKGRIQIVVKNDNSTGIKLFLVPYDLTGLERNGQGGKTFLRQKSYSIDIDPITNTPLSASNTTPPTSSPNPSNDNKGKLRYAVHLHFCSPPSSSPPSPTKSSPTTSVKREQPAYYLYSTIRVVFAPSRALDSLSSYRVVAEGPTGALDGDFNSSPAGGSAFMPYKGAGEEWERERKKAKARQRCRELVGTPLRQGQQDESEREEGDAMVTRRDSYDAAHDYSPGLTSELLTTIPSYSPPPSLSLDSLSSTLPSPKLSTASFAPVVRSRLSVVTRSGLSSSRPVSPESRSRTGSRTRSDEAGR